MKKSLYYRELRQWVEMEDRIANGIEADRTRIRKKEQQNGRCFVTKKKMFLCDGLCDDCEFHRQGGRVVDTKHCEDCEIPTDRRGRASKCRECQYCTFIYESTTLDEPVGEEDSTTYGELIPSTAKGPEELAVEKITAEEYCREAEAITPDGAQLAARLMDEEKVSEAARAMGKDQRTLNSRKTTLKKKLKIHQ